MIYIVRKSTPRFTRFLACIASVPVGLGSKERPRNGTGKVFCPRKTGARAKIKERGGWRRGRKETLSP